MASFIKAQDHLSVVLDDGEVLTVYPNNPNYREVVDALNAKEWERVRALAKPAHAVKVKLEATAVADRVRVEHGVVYLDGDPLHNTLTVRMVEMVDDGFDITPMALFLQNLMENPSYRAVQELFGFLEKSNLPITEDGHFIAYKRVRSNFMDEWSGKMDNSPGKIVSMPRNQVNEDPNQTCSDGLHFCSREYLPHYGSTGGGQVVMLKINPRDVVAIPTDYDNAKGRTCRYEVLRALTLEGTCNYSMPEENLEGSLRTEDGDVPKSNVPEFVDLLQAENRLDEAERKGTLAVAEVSEAGNILTVYASASEAEKTTGVNASSIGKVCRGVRKRAGGRIWQYVTESNLTDLAADPIEDDYDDPYFEELDYDDGWW